MIEKKDLTFHNQKIIEGYELAIDDVFNIIVSDCLGESLIGHYLSYEGHEKAAEEFRDELVSYMIASKRDLINTLADQETVLPEVTDSYE